MWLVFRLLVHGTCPEPSLSGVLWVFSPSTPPFAHYAHRLMVIHFALHICPSGSARCVHDEVRGNHSCPSRQEYASSWGKTRGNPPRARVDHCPKRPRVMCLQSDDSDPGPNPAIQEIWICSSLTIGLTISFTPRGSSRLNPPAKGLCIGWSDDWVSKWIRWTSRAESRPAHMGQLMTWIITICNWFSHQQIPPQYFFFIVL